MCDAYAATSSLSDGGDGAPEEDRIAVMMFVAGEWGKEGRVDGQVWPAASVPVMMRTRHALQVSLLEKCLLILERKFGSKSYECVEALDKLAGDRSDDGCHQLHAPCSKPFNPVNDDVAACDRIFRCFSASGRSVQRQSAAVALASDQDRPSRQEEPSRRSCHGASKLSLETCAVCIVT